MIYIVYWRHKEPPRTRHFGYVEAVSAEDAYNIVSGMLQEGNHVTAVYKDPNGPTPQSLCLNFKAPDYTGF